MFFLKKTEKQNVVERPISRYEIATTYYLIVLIHSTLEHLGFFDILRKEKVPTKIDELSKIIKVRVDLLESCINFLWSTTDYLEKTEQGITLKNSAPKWFWMVAYKPIFDSLEDLLVGIKKYEKDIVRDGYYLQRLSVIAGKPVEEYIIRQVQEIRERSILIDLGCGPATLLIRANLSNPLIDGIGVDIDPVITDAAQKNVAKSGHLVKIVTADVHKIHSWKKYIPKNANLIFSANTILHELLRNGEENFISFLKTLKDTFPGSRFFVTEVDALSPNEVRDGLQDNYKSFMAMYMLIHSLTEQGMPRPQKEWLSFFEKSGWFVARAERPSKGDTRIVYDCRL